MILLYILLVAYILAINFYAFLLVKQLRDRDLELEKIKLNGAQSSESAQHGLPPTAPTTEKYIGKLLTTGLLGGAITIYVCMFIFKWKRSELLLMVLMPLFSVLNIYLWVLLFRSGFSFLAIR